MGRSQAVSARLAQGEAPQTRQRRRRCRGGREEVDETASPALVVRAKVDHDPTGVSDQENDEDPVSEPEPENPDNNEPLGELGSVNDQEATSEPEPENYQELTSEPEPVNDGEVEFGHAHEHKILSESNHPENKNKSTRISLIS